MKGAAPAEDDDERAMALGRRLRAWFAALSRQPVPERLSDHVEDLERREPAAVQEPPAG